MKSILLYLFYIIASYLSEPCKKLVRRPEIRELTPAQLKKLATAFHKLNTGKADDIFNSYTKLHIDYSSYAHFNPAFFPWHRVFLQNIQNAIWKIDPEVIIPYWDWSKDSQAPERSVVLTDAYFGGNGRKEDNQVVNGLFANFKVAIPNEHFLKRQYLNGDILPAFLSPELIEAIITVSKDFQQFWNLFELVPHGLVHGYIGGLNGDLQHYYSPNDPLFYLHHGFLDKIWYEWQQRNPKLANVYEGVFKFSKFKETDILVPFNKTVKSALNTKGDGFCYYYDRFSSKTDMIKVITSALQYLGLTSKNFITNPQALPGTLKIVFNQMLAFIQINIEQITRNQVNSYDRVTKNKLRIPGKIPDFYIANFKLNATYIREIEKDISTLVGVLNSYSNSTLAANLTV